MKKYGKIGLILTFWNNRSYYLPTLSLIDIIQETITPSEKFCYTHYSSKDLSLDEVELLSNLDSVVANFSNKGDFLKNSDCLIIPFPSGSSVNGIISSLDFILYSGPVFFIPY